MNKKCEVKKEIGFTVKMFSHYPLNFNYEYLICNFDDSETKIREKRKHTIKINRKTFD